MKRLLSWPLGGCLLLASSLGHSQVSGRIVLDQSMVGAALEECTSQTPKTPADEFRKLVCEFHWSSGETDLNKLDARIETARKLQRLGVRSGEQALMSMIEGVAHCDKARAVWEEIESNTLSKGIFCDARASGIAAFNSIAWDHAEIGYTDDTGRTPFELIKLISSCYAADTGPMNPKWSKTCKLGEDLTIEAEAQVVSDAYDVVAKRHFGASSPITRLFQEKYQIASSTLDGIEKKQKPLEQASINIKSFLNGMSGPFYDAIKDPNKATSPLDTVVDHYKDSYVTAKAILNRYQEWEKGLLVEKTSSGVSHDLADDLVDNPDSMEKRLLSLQDALLGPKDGVGAVAIADSLIRRLQREQADIKPATKRLCAIYYCHLAVGNSDRSLYKTACRTTELFTRQKNPLCQNVNLPLKAGDDSFTVRDLCGAAEFPASFSQVGMSAEQAKSCTIL